MNHVNTVRRYLLHYINVQMMGLAVVQPLVVVLITNLIPDNLFLISVSLAGMLGSAVYLSRSDVRSHVLYYWTVLSITYIIVLFEVTVVPLAEITPTENFYLVLLTLFSLFFIYLTMTNTSRSNSTETGLGSNGQLLLNDNGPDSFCPACRVRLDPRNYHCSICKECISKYDHHSYWLNCCIGEHNFHYYVAAIFFGMLALTYGSLLILTTVCSPSFHFGILLPDDCSYVCETIDTCACLVCGIYCLELGTILLFKFLHHSWLISRGFSMFEWREQPNSYSSGTKLHYSNGFLSNWIQFLKKFRNIPTVFWNTVMQ